MTAMVLRVLISGLGMMGGSLAAALHRTGAQVWLQHRRPEVAENAAARGWGRVWGPERSPIDIAIVGCPPAVVPSLIRQLADQTDALLTDMASTKAGICSELADLAHRFVGSHPMCGSHRQGLDAADARLFHGATVAITPLPSTPPVLVDRITTFWHLLETRTHQLSPADHDRLVAEASHLPHVLACLTARLLTDEGLPLAAAGFRDTSRKAAGSPAMWGQILHENIEAVRQGIGRARADLDELDRALADRDAEGLLHWLQEAHRRRQAFEVRDA